MKELRRFDLSKGFDPKDIKDLKENELEALASDIRENILSNTAKNGGHLSSNLGIVELTMEIHKFFDLPNDKVIFDVGHQCYTHKILSGRSLEHLRKEDGVSGFQKREESVYDCYEAGHSSTSISAAMGMALARDLNGDNYNVIAVIGDSAFANGLSLEAMDNLGNFNHKVIIIINDNDRSISSAIKGISNNYFERMRLSKRYLKAKATYKRVLCKHKITKPIYTATSAIKNFFSRYVFRKKILKDLNLYYITKVDGHDFKAMEKAFKLALNAPTSVIVHVTTTKGKGYELAEKDVAGTWHGVEPFNVETGEKLNQLPDGYYKWSHLYSELLMDEMEKDEKAILINPATTVGSHLDDIFKKYPARCFDVGISEEHAATFASGIATNGNHVFVSMYSTFLQRAYDEVSHDIARMDLPVTLMVDRVGLPGDDGETHQGLFDIAYLSSIPNVAIAMAKDQNEARALVEFARTYKHPLAIRYPRGAFKLNEDKGLSPLSLGEWKIENNGKDIAVISYGQIVNELLNKFNNVEIVNAIFQKPVNEEILKGLLGFKHIVIYDIYGTKEGFANIVTSKLVELGYKGDIHVMAIPSDFIRQASIQRQLEILKVDINSLEELIKGLK